MLPHKKVEASTTSQPVAKKESFWSRLPFFHSKKKAPPHAQGLERVGIIRTVGNDGSFVIIEMEPGVVVPPGRELLVVGSSGVIHLKSAETQPPYFIADVVSGEPMAGQIVQQ